MKKFFKILGIVLLTLIIIIILVLGYFGFIPGVATLFGSDKPRDLGVRFTSEDLTSAQRKLEQKFVEPKQEMDPYEQLKSSESVPVETVISEEELSAHLERVNPISDVQVKINGSSFEMSGRIVKSRIPQFVRTLGITDASDGEILNAVNQYLPFDLIFYMSGTGNVTNDNATINLHNAEVGRLPVPVDTASEVLDGYIETLLEQAPGFSAESLTLDNGQLRFKGTSTKEIPNY